MVHEHQPLRQRFVAQLTAVARDVRDFLGRIFPPLRRKELREEQEKHQGRTPTPMEQQQNHQKLEQAQENEHLPRRKPRSNLKEELLRARKQLDADSSRSTARDDNALQRSLEDALGDPMGPTPGERVKRVLGVPGVGDPMAAQAEQEIQADLVESLREELGGGVGSQWAGSFTVHFHPTERRISAVRGPKRAAEKGMAVTRIDRLPVDGMVFDRKRPGGSVLVDHSGSMSLSHEQVAAAIETFPALTIGRYSGPRYSYGGATGEGTLCVLAEHGVLGELDGCSVGGGGNDVDIEGLAWLAKQPEPRVWVSDGQVCGGLVETLGAEQAHQVITSLCQRHRIVRVPTFEDAVHALRRGVTRGVAVTPRDSDFLPSISPDR